MSYSWGRYNRETANILQTLTILGATFWEDLDKVLTRYVQKREFDSHRLRQSRVGNSAIRTGVYSIGLCDAGSSPAPWFMGRSEFVIFTGKENTRIHNPCPFNAGRANGKPLAS